jgi:hypothetical protein
MPNPYQRSTSNSFEKKINRANVRAGQASGKPSYPHLNRQRQDLLRQAEGKRPLRRSEFVHLYGYEAWLDYCEKYGLPDTHKWADAHQHKLSSIK